jgi:hypothetical protein
MASDNFDIPHITMVGVPDDNYPPSSLAFPSPSLDTSHSQAERRSPTYNHDHLSRSTPISRLAGNLQTSSIHWAANSIVSRDNNQAPAPSVASYNSSFRLSPLRSTHSNVTIAPSPTHTTPSSDAGSRTSSVTRFFRRTIHRVKRSSSSLSGDTGSDSTRNDGQKGDNADAKRKRAQLARRAVLDLKQEADSDFFRKQRNILRNLEERLEAANKLHGEALDLQALYESGTVSNMRDLRATGKATPRCPQVQNKDTWFSGIPRPLPQDDALFCEVDLVLAEIGRFYDELKKFWKEEICHVVEALKKGRTDPKDFERWKIFHSSLKQTMESWKV